MRSNQTKRSFSHDTATCISPTVKSALIAPTNERSSPSTALTERPPNRKSTTMSIGACWLAVRRPISRITNSTMM